ncbi:uncharacterized protein O3C94_007125 [Discoglossus pictus]
MVDSAGKPLSHAMALRKLVDWGTQHPLQAAILKLKAHTNSTDEHSRGNAHVDVLAKQAALEGNHGNQERQIQKQGMHGDNTMSIPDLTPHIVRSHPLSLSQVPDASHSTPCERNRERNSVTSQASAIIRQQDRDKMVKQLIKFKPLFPHYDAKIDVLSNMSNFESSVKQYMLSPKEACVMLKLWLPGALASRLEAPVSGPNDSNRDWFKEHKWGTEGDRLRAVCRLVTGNRDLDSHSLAEMRVTVQDDPWVFASKFEQVYRLTHRVPPDQTPSDMLQYLVRTFTYLDPSIQIMAEEKDTMEAVLCIIGKARQNILRKGVTGPRQIAIVTTNEGRRITHLNLSKQESSRHPGYDKV